MKHRVHLIQAIILAACIIAGAAVIGPLQALADRRAEVVKNRLIGRLEAELGISVRYRSVSPALLSLLTVRDVRVKFSGGSFRAERIRIFYSPLRSLRRSEGGLQSLITRVAVHRGRLSAEISARRPEVKAGPLNSSAPWKFLEAKTLVLSDFSSRLSFEDLGVVDADDIDLVLSGEPERTRYRFEGVLRTRNPLFFPELGAVSADIRSLGSFSAAQSAFNGRFDILQAASDILVLKPMAVDLTFSPEGLTLRRIDDELPVDIALSGSARGMSMNAQMVDLVLRDIAEPGRSAQVWNPWFDTVLNGSFSAELGGGEPRPIYRIDMAAEVPENSILRWPASLFIEASGNRLSASIKRLEARVPWGKAAYEGSFGFDELVPEGVLSFSVFDESLGGPLNDPVNAAFALGPEGRMITANPLYFAAGGLRFHDFRFLVLNENDQVSLSLLAASGMPDKTAMRRIFIDALLDTADTAPSFIAFAQVEGFELSHAARILGAGTPASLPAAADALINLSGMFEASRDSWVLSVDQGEIISRDNQDNRISFRGRASPERWSLDALRLSWNDFAADGRFSARRGSRGGLAAGRIILGEEVYPLKARWDRGGSLTVSGDFGFKGVLGPKSSAGRPLALIGESIEIPSGGGRLSADFRLKGIVGRKDWEMYLQESRFTRSIIAGDVSSTTEFNGTISADRLALPTIRFIDDLGTLAGNAVFERLPGNAEVLGRLLLISAQNERYDISALRSNNDWEVSLSVQNGRLERFDRERLSGLVNLEGSLSGALEDPLIQLKVDTQEAAAVSRPFELKGSADLKSGKLRIQDAVFSRDGIAVESGLVLIDFKTGGVRAAAEFRAAYNQIPVSSGVSLAVDFEKIPMNPRALMDGSFTGTLATRAVIWDEQVHWPAFTFQFVKTEEEFVLRTPDAQVLSLSYRFADGRLDIASGAPMPITVFGGGTVLDGMTDLSFSSLSIDPGVINYVMVRDPVLLQYHVIFQDGKLVGSLDIRGPAASPRMYGRLRAVNLKVDTPYTYAGIRPAGSDIHFRGNRIDFDRIEIPIGEGIAYGEGYLVLDSWKIVDYDMIYGLRGSAGEGVPVYYPLMGIYLDGLAAGEIRMRGDSTGYNLTGDINFPSLKASLGSPRVPVSQRRPGRRITPVRLDFSLTTGSNCTFYLPNEQIKIVRAAAEANQTLKLTYGNQPRSLSVTGVLPIKSGDIFYFDRNFQVTQGSLRFNETLREFDPILAFRAETRVRDSQQEPVSVTLVYNAPVKSDFNPSVETVPARSNAEILVLLGQAVVPFSDEGAAGGVQTLLQATGGAFAQLGLVQPFEKVLREGLNLDMVTIRTDIIGNALADSLNRGVEIGALDRGSGLGRFLDNTSLSAGKYIGNALFVSGSVSARYFQGQRLRSMFGGLEFETSFSLEMATPFFNVGWSYTPNIEENRSFIADNSISLKWQFSY